MPESALVRAIPLPDLRPRRLPVVWLLLGGRAGDNNQLLALADALAFPFDVKKLCYNSGKRLPRRPPGLATLSEKSRNSIKAPWPDLVLCVGYASVPVARFIRQQSGGLTKLVHVGNPREAIDDFELQITTPQYPRLAPNLLELPFPIGNPARRTEATQDELEWLDQFPHPRRLIAVGGPARHWELDEAALAAAIQQLSGNRGCLIVATSPRTPQRTKRLLQKLVSGANTALVADFPRFGTLLSRCQEIFVTADSVSMISEAVLTGRPVGIISIRRSFFGKLSHWLWERPLGRRTKPDLRNFWSMLESRQFAGTVDLPVAAQVCDTVQRAADAVRSLLAAAGVFVDDGKQKGADPHLGAARRASGRQ